MYQEFHRVLLIHFHCKYLQHANVKPRAKMKTQYHITSLINKSRDCFPVNRFTMPTRWRQNYYTLITQQWLRQVTKMYRQFTFYDYRLQNIYTHLKIVRWNRLASWHAEHRDEWTFPLRSCPYFVRVSTAPPHPEPSIEAARNSSSPPTRTCRRGSCHQRSPVTS